MAAGDHDVGLGDFLQDVRALVGHDHDADIRVDGAERVVCSLGLAGAGEGVEEGGLAYVGQADDASFEHKVRTVSRRGGPVNGKAVGAANNLWATRRLR